MNLWKDVSRTYLYQVFLPLLMTSNYPVLERIWQTVVVIVRTVINFGARCGGKEGTRHMLQTPPCRRVGCDENT